MTLDEYNAFCASLPQTSHVVQWGGSHVWKVGGASGKVFAIATLSEEASPFITFKCSPMSFDLLKHEAGMRPAPYLASRGMSWLQRTNSETLEDLALHDYLRESYRLAAMRLPKTIQKTLISNRP
jgi:predicted DNA-binding protein (MmcQ/YjbR family)